MNWKNFENFLSESSCGCEVNLYAFARCEEFCAFYGITINVTKTEVESVDIDAQIYTKQKVNLNEETRKQIEEKAGGIGLDLINRAGVDEYDTDWRVSFEFLRDKDEYENEKMFALCSSRSWKAFDY